MKYYFLILVSFFLFGCETLPQNPEFWMEKQINACLPTAISFREGLKKYNVWSEVVVYQYFDVNKKKNGGHAIVAYMYPTGKNQLWTYDYMGSYRTRAFKDDPVEIARQAELLRGRYSLIKKSEFLK
jgi:hypothetical protein